MAVTKVLGTKGVIKMSGTAVQLVKSIDFSMTQNTVKVTDNDNSGLWDDYLTGDRGGTCSFTVHWDSVSVAAGVHEKFVDATTGITLATPVVKTFIYYPAGTTTGNRIFTFDAWIKSTKLSVSHEAVVEMSVDLEITGAIVAGTA